MEILRRLWAMPKSQPKSQAEALARIDDAMRAEITRGRRAGDRLDVGPNLVHALVMRGPSGEFGKPGSFEDLGWNHNYRTTAGMDWLHNTMGGVVLATQGGPATAVGATSFNATGTPGWASNAIAGYRVVFPVTGLTTAPVWANILGNATGSAPTVQVDGWWNAAETAGTQPAGTNAYLIIPGQGPAKWIGLTADNTSHPNEVAAGTTSLTAEITANQCGRALATFAHTGGGTTYTLVKTWNANGTQTVHRAGNFTGGYGASGGGIMVAGTDLNADATLASGDSLQVTWTWTLPAAGA